MLSLSDFRYIPYFGPSLQVPFKEYLQKQKEKLHVKPGTDVATVSGNSVLSVRYINYLVNGTVLMMGASGLVGKGISPGHFDLKIWGSIPSCDHL